MSSSKKKMETIKNANQYNENTSQEIMIVLMTCLVVKMRILQSSLQFFFLFFLAKI